MVRVAYIFVGMEEIELLYEESAALSCIYGDLFIYDYCQN